MICLKRNASAHGKVKDMERQFVAGNCVVDITTGKTGVIIAPPAGESVQINRVWVQWNAGGFEQIEFSRLRLLPPEIAAGEAVLKELGITLPEKRVSTFSASDDV